MDVESLAVELRDHVIKCEAANIKTANALESLSHDVQAFKELPGKAVRWIALTIAGAVMSILVQNFWLHQETARKTDAAANEATQAAAAVQQIPQKTADAVSARLPEKNGADQ